MNFNAPSFFAGIAGTVGILALGFGGGVMVSGMLSGGPRPPNKVEQQAAARDLAAKELTDARPTIEPKPVTAVQQPAAPPNPPAQSAAAAPPAEPPPPPAAVPPPAPAAAPPVAKAEPAAVPQPQRPQPPAPPPQPTREAAAPPSVEKPVSLTQPQAEETRQLSRREIGRLLRQQRREERAQRRAERRQQMDARREARQDSPRFQRDDERGFVIERRPRRQAVEDADDDDVRPPASSQVPFGGPFGLFRGY